MSEAGRIPGQIVVRARAQERVMAALAAEELDVPLRDAKVRVRDDHGRVAASVAAPARVDDGRPPLTSIIERTRQRLFIDGARLTGAEISEISVRITSIIDNSGRVS